MESRRRMTTRKQAQQQSGSVGGVVVVVDHSAKESLSSTKKAGARKTAPRKPLADRTNDSPIYGLTPCDKRTGRKSSPTYERTPISKLRSFKSTPGTPGEEILRSQVQSMLEKVKANESMGEAMQYSPLFSSSSAGSVKSQYHTPATSFPTISQPSNFPLSIQVLEEQAQTEIQSPIKSPEVLQMEQPQVLATSKDETSESEDKDGGALPLDMQLLYMFGKAAAAPASDLEMSDGSQDLDVLKAVEKVITCMEEGKLEAKCEDKEDTDGVSDGVSDCCIAAVNSVPLSLPTENDNLVEKTELPSFWKQRGGGSVKMVKSTSQERISYEEYEEEGNYEVDEQEEGGEYEELRRGISHISMRDSKDGFGPPPFAGRHTRFHYNSDGEMDSVQVDEEDTEKSPEGPATPTTVMQLKGLPTPKGKHLRFTEDI